MVRIGKKQLESMDFILNQFIITHREGNKIYGKELKVAKNILNKIERERAYLFADRNLEDKE